MVILHKASLVHNLHKIGRTRAAEKARTAQQQGSRRTVQGQGAVIYEHGAPTMVTERGLGQAELNQAAAALEWARDSVEKVVKAPWLALFKYAKVEI